MHVVGYTDSLSARPGETLRFRVSCQRPTYRAEIVRLRHTDTNPDGPGLITEPVDSDVAGHYPGRAQGIHLGSCVLVPHAPALNCAGGFVIQAWICPTTPGSGEQAILTKMPADGTGGFRLYLSGDGAPTLEVSGVTGHQKLSTRKPLAAWEWYHVRASYDADRGRLELAQKPQSYWLEEEVLEVDSTAVIGAIGANPADLLLAAGWIDDGRKRTGHHFNGKIDSPRLDNANGAAVAAWDFAADIGTDRVRDTSGNRLDGRALNLPARGMTGHNWNGDEVDFKVAPAQYGAMHFHDDDLEDAGWEEAFCWTVPADLPSGIYAAHLTCDGGEDYLPFAVTPGAGQPQAPIAFLLPTVTYQIYANQRFRDPIRQALNQPTELAQSPEDRYMREHNLMCTYDAHTDGTGVCYASRLRPLLNIRPGYRSPPQSLAGGWPRLLNADMHLVHWLDQKGFAYDVITDDDLHAEGASLLQGYRVVVTGTHPEYWTGPMLDGLSQYRESGGRLMYLGGNGFYWITSFDPNRPHVTEVRRWRGSRAWEGREGEHYHSTTGEMGGNWRYRNRAPQKMLGVGFTSQGSGVNRPYRLLPDSRDPRAAFIFEGIEEDELIGDIPALVLGHGAGGFEIDRVDYDQGTPRHALVLARTHDHPDSYQLVIEDQLCSTPFTGGSQNDLVHADMVYCEGPNGGTVFSVGSISWCSCLSYRGGDNNVSRVTENVLRAFAADG